jgi:hypothetical protein
MPWESSERTEKVKTIIGCAWFLCGLGISVSAFAQGSSANDDSKRVRIFVNGAFNPAGLSFSDSSTFTSFLEEGSSSRTYDGGKGAVFEGGALVGITDDLGVMGSIELYQSDFDATFEESLPHPLFFDEPRVVSGAVTGLEYSEKAVHLDAVYTRDFSDWTVDLFGGPSFFFTNTEVLNTVNAESSYPFDEAAVRSTSSVQLDDNPIGFNAGGALTWRLTDVLGVVFQVRYSHASIGVAREGANEIELDAGGFRVGGGIRLSF